MHCFPKGNKSFSFSSQRRALPLLDAKRPLICGGILVMLSEVGGKIMIAGKIFSRTHVEIVTLDVIQHGVNIGDLRHVDRTRRKARIFVRVVR